MHRLGYLTPFRRWTVRSLHRSGESRRLQSAESQMNWFRAKCLRPAPLRSRGGLGPFKNVSRKQAGRGRCLRPRWTCAWANGCCSGGGGGQWARCGRGRASEPSSRGAAAAAGGGEGGAGPQAGVPEPEARVPGRWRGHAGRERWPGPRPVGDRRGGGCSRGAGRRAAGEASRGVRGVGVTEGARPGGGSGGRGLGDPRSVRGALLAETCRARGA